MTCLLFISIKEFTRLTQAQVCYKAVDNELLAQYLPQHWYMETLFEQRHKGLHFPICDFAKLVQDTGSGS